MDIFMRAVEMGDIRKIRKLLKQEINLNEQDENGNTALGLAAGYGHTEMVKLYNGPHKRDTIWQGKSDTPIEVLNN